MYMKNLLFLLLFIAAGNQVGAQLDTVISHFSKIGTYYDSTRSLAFDVKFEYESDTLLGNYEHRENQGTFIMNGNRYYYKLDHTECMQTDSFMLTVMDKEQLIMVGRPTPFASGGVVPLRDKMDSLKKVNFAGYTYMVTKTDSVYAIYLSATDTANDIQKISLFYDPFTYSIIQYVVAFDYLPEDDGIIEAGELIRMSPTSPRHMKLKVSFLNYRPADIEEDMFNVDRYVKADGTGQWIGVGKYEGFVVTKLFD